MTLTLIAALSAVLGTGSEVRLIAATPDTEVGGIPVVASQGPGVPVREGRADATGRVSLPLGPGEWQITCVGASVWCPPSKIVSSGQLSLPVFSTKRVTGLIASHSGAPLPDELTIQVAVRPVGTDPVELTTPVTVRNRGFELSLPDAPLDLRIAANGFAPHYVWDFRVARDGKVLGPISLAKGASVVGTLVDPGDGRPVSGAYVRAVMLSELAWARTPDHGVRNQDQPDRLLSAIRPAFGALPPPARPRG